MITRAHPSKLLAALVLVSLLFSPQLARAQGYLQQGQKLVGTAVGNAQQGSSIALSADGNTAILGGHGDNSNTRAARVFTQSSGVWPQQGASW